MKRPSILTWRRRNFLQASAFSLSLLPAKFSAASSICEFTPSTDDGPLYPVDEIPWLSDLTRVDGRDGVADGQFAYLFGQVKNVACEPVSDATVEIWQADSRGQYKHPRHTTPEDLDPNFGYFGKVRVDADGWYVIKTIVPKWYRIFEIDRAEHIHMKVRSPDNGVLTTEVYFEGDNADARRAGDRVYQGLRNKEKLVLATDDAPTDLGLDIPAEADAAYCRFDVMYRL